MCVSLYTPTHRHIPETEQDPIRFKNLLREAEERLIASGLSAREVRELLQPAQKLLEDASFWKFQSDGLALFLSANLFRTYCLPFGFTEMTVVTNRFHLKPLLQVLTGDGRFFILALSQKQVRLLEGTAYADCQTVAITARTTSTEHSAREATAADTLLSGNCSMDLSLLAPIQFYRPLTAGFHPISLLGLGNFAQRPAGTLCFQAGDGASVRGIMVALLKALAFNSKD